MNLRHALAAGLTTALSFCGVASAQTPIFTIGTLTAYWYPGGANEGSTVFGNCFVATSGGTVLNVEQIKFYVYRLQTAGVLTPVTLNLSLAPMTFNGTAFAIGTEIPMGSVTFGSEAATANQVWTVTTVLGSQLIPLEVTSNPGLGGFWVGGKFSGTTSSSAKNNFLFGGAPTLGAAINRFWLRSAAGVDTGPYWFGAETTNARLATDVSGFIGDPPVPTDPCLPANIIQGVVGNNVVTIDQTYPELNLGTYCTGDFGTNTIINNAKYIKYTALVSGSYTVQNCSDTTGSIDARIAALTECGNASTALACDDDGCTSGAAPYTAKMIFNATAGTTYYFAVGGYSTATVGPFNVEIIPPAAAPCPADLNSDGVVNGADLGLLLGSWGVCPGCPADLNADGVVNGADLGLMLGSWGACP